MTPSSLLAPVPAARTVVLPPEGSIDDVPPQPSYWHAGARDLRGGLAVWPLWTRMAWEDIRQRYRRSVLGPFWLSLSMLIMVGTLGFVYSKIFHQDLRIYLPFLTLGFLFWGLMQDLVREGCLAFTAAEGLIRQLRVPVSTHAYRTVCRQFLVFAHNCVVFVPVALIFRVPLGPVSLLAVPGLLLWLLTAVWVALFFGVLSTRFRDIPPLVSNLLQIVFFLSPIIWPPAQLGTRAGLVEYNPVYHYLELVRAPLLGREPDPLSWAVVGGLTVLGWAVTFPFFARFRARIAYWL